MINEIDRMLEIVAEMPESTARTDALLELARLQTESEIALLELWAAAGVSF